MAGVLAVLALIAAAGGAGFFLLRDRGEPARDALTAYAAAWSRGDDRAAARLTDQPGPALSALRASRKGLDDARVRAVVRADEETGTATLAVAWDIPRIGRWAYRTRVAGDRGDDGWRVRWAPTLVHPELDSATRLGTTGSRPGGARSATATAGRCHRAARGPRRRRRR